ncbi:hypothetical protein ACQT3V_03270 [Brucella sp. NF 2653]|uniref:hypothetical protein n=1 Tax=Brucella sp. NF 2653 TaxID=693748 RepID=UPI003D0A3B13
MPRRGGSGDPASAKKSKAFALPIEYAFDLFSILLAAAETAPGSILPRLDRVKPTFYSVVALMVKKIANRTAFVTKNLLLRHNSFVKIAPVW